MKITRFILLFKFLSFSNALVQNHFKNFGNFKTKKLSDCKAELDDGRIVDLSSLDSPSNPISVINGNQEYFYNPCTAIECDPNSIKNTAVCQKIKDSHEVYNCGEQNTAFFDFKNNNLYISYTSRDRKTTIQCECSSKQKLEFSSERPEKNYFLNLKSPCCCPNKCNGKKPTKSSGLSLGSVLLIIFFSCLFVYIIGGIVLLKFFQKKNGIEVIPNYQFWSSLPGDVKSGISFTMSKVRRNNNSYNQI